MADFARLSENWLEWVGKMGLKKISVSMNCDDCQVLFSSDDYSVHLRNDGTWWVVDVIDDRGQRSNGIARLSTFDLAEKYLIWKWVTLARSSLASGPLGTDLYRRGYAPDVEISRAKGGIEICLGNDRAVLSTVDATVFSHLMSKSVDEIEQIAREPTGG